MPLTPTGIRGACGALFAVAVLAIPGTALSY